MPRLYWVVGELSGEMYAAPLARSLQEKNPGLQQRGMGSTLLAQAGVDIAVDWGPYSVVGFWEVLKNLPRYVSLYRYLWQDIRRWRPDRVILIDYPGLNLRLARRLQKAQIPVTYFIPPQLWAWNPGRVRALKSPLIQVLCILPFEPAFYAQYAVPAVYVGHPLVRLMQAVTPFTHRRPYMAILPGSRLAEVRNTLPIYVAAAQQFPDYDFFIAGVSHLPATLYDRYRQGYPVIYGQTRALLKGATAALVTSGTATLEAALAQTPSLIGYKGNPLSYYLAKQLVRVPYIGLPNLILQEPVFPELIQGHLTPEAVTQTLRDLLLRQDTIRPKLRAIADRLGDQDAINCAAEHILKALSATGTPA